MLITKCLEIRVFGNWRYYESKGYIVPKKENGRVSQDTILTINVTDLPENSRFDIEYKCQGCKETKTTRYGRYIKNEHKLCRGCNMKRIAQDKEYIKKRSGENAGNYNPNLTDEEREQGRYYSEYPLWRTAVYEECDYTCQSCEDNRGGNLIAHHLNGWHWAKEERFDLCNGVAICETCHDEFHERYGYRDNTRNQFMDFLIEKVLARNSSPASQLFGLLHFN